MSITGALRSTPTATIEIFWGLMPLHLDVMERACMMRLRTRKEIHSNGSTICVEVTYNI
ncbi:Hypothetical protein FKW44_002821 [Caligus rogercresseyi]|uniref:Uncharacterized protein n=1 Tax=Caligus rogercresseyi TaxID=217165 RepID=A0A7T8KKP9_CALRO|nr:Hypothetical protein FKW44_002821 [Caligus rogercresseyi]